jgi:hypothetical protein
MEDIEANLWATIAAGAAVMSRTSVALDKNKFFALLVAKEVTLCLRPEYWKS